ncbi:MAG: radical SAM protein [Fluviicola sp. XM-24bin1]|nr:MAG: radical SAM protein [Fluviicola sp. XM-24bin1]
MAKHVVLFNPRSADAKHRIPNSILQVGSSIDGKFPFHFVDGNLESDPLQKILALIESNDVGYLGMTVMPGPQLTQAIPFTKEIRQKYPNIKIIWGGYFAANQHKVVLESGWVDYVINGPGDSAFPDLLDALETDNLEAIPSICNLIYKNEEGKIVSTKKEPLPDMDNLPKFAYQKLNETYPLESYLAKTFMGRKTLSYHSSFGCPFTCSFCAVVPIYNARWKGLSAERMADDVLGFKSKYGIDAVEFHDNNFFTSRKRVVEFSEKIKDENIAWWGEGRIDTINKYSDDDLQLMQEAGLRMIFLGAETGNDEVLKQMDKGGTQSGAQIKEFAGRLKKFGIVPEYSFVLGMPGDSSEKVMRQINQDIQFIQEIKRINPETEIIIYVYSPVPTEGSELYETIQEQGFSFPKTLEDWLSPDWERFDLRKNPLTPWLNAKHIKRIKNFETVLNGMYPTSSDFRITKGKRKLLRLVSSWRYKTGFFAYPYEIKLLLKIWKYRQPEEQGFYSE